MVKIICSNKQFNFVLIFRNQKCAADINIFAKVLEKMNENAAADGWKNRITHRLEMNLRNKFLECKSVSLSHRIANGIYSLPSEKKLWIIVEYLFLNYHWQQIGNLQTLGISLSHHFTIAIKILNTKKSLGSSKNITTDMKGECKPKEIKKSLKKSLLTFTESFIDNNPTVELLKFMTEENGKSRNYEIEMKNLMSS